MTLDTAYNELPPAQPGPGWLDRIEHSINGSTLLTLEIDPALGIQSDSAPAPGGEFMTARVRTVSPSNRQAYFDWQANELAPALRRAGLKDLRSGRIIAGGNTNTFVRYSYSDSYPGDGGIDIPGTAGQREFDRIIGRESALLVTSEDIIYRFREDLSFTADQ